MIFYIGDSSPYKTIQTNWQYSLTCIGPYRSSCAVSFYTISISHHIYWVAAGMGITGILFFKRPPESAQQSLEDVVIARWSIIPAVFVLVFAGYFLDPVVSFASEQSHAPKGVIGFFVLATLSSWPEFKSCLTL